MLTDDEFITAVTKLRAIETNTVLIEIYDKALECVRRPATRAQTVNAGWMEGRVEVTLVRAECIDCGAPLTRIKKRCSRCSYEESQMGYNVARADRRRAKHGTK